MRAREAVLFALVVLTGALAGCATLMGEQPTLYERLTARDFLPGGAERTVSGRDAIALVVDDFVANVVADSRINARFKPLQPAAVNKLKSNLADQICEASGGPCSYMGRDVKETHKGMNISDAEWSATLEALVKALDRRKVPEKEKSELLGLLGPMKGDIVGR